MDTVRINRKNVLLIAHRGLSGLERENTYPAFVAAGNRSYFGIETDVHKTKDGKFVIIHDENTMRVSLGEHIINVEENDYSALKDIVLPDLDGSKERQDIRIPLLSDYIKICKKYGKKCVLEIKNTFSEEDLKRLIQEIKKEEYLENVIFISFVLNNCINLRKLLPENDIQWLTNGLVTEDMIKTLVKYKMNIDIFYEILDKERIDKFHAYGIKVNCWTVDDKDKAEKLVSNGVDFITTNILE